MSKLLNRITLRNIDICLELELESKKTKVREDFTIIEKAPARAFFWLKVQFIAFTFKTLLRHCAKQTFTPRSLNVKLGPQHKSQKGRAG